MRVLQRPLDGLTDDGAGESRLSGLAHPEVPVPAVPASPPTNRQHDGRITTDTPDELWATDPTDPWMRLDGRCAVFTAVDHCTGEAWIDAAPRMDRWAAADLLSEAILDRFGSVEAGVAAGLKLRHDGGSCSRSGYGPRSITSTSSAHRRSSTA